MAKHRPPSAAAEAPNAGTTGTTRTGAGTTGSVLMPWLALLLVAIGLILSVILTRNYYQHVLAGQVSGCSISAYVDCDRVSQSPFAAVAGVPISAAALMVYVALGVLLALPLGARFRSSERALAEIATVLTGAGSLVAVGLALLSALVIGGLCLYCALLQVTTIGLFLLLLWRRGALKPRSRPGARSRPQARRPPVPKRAIASATVALLAGVVVALAAALGFEAEALSTGTRAAGLALAQADSAYLARRVHVFETDGVPGVGPADAPVRLMVFGDYNCSHCRNFDPEALRLAVDFPDQVRVYFKFYPLDGTCNRTMGSRTSTSCLAAAAAYAAHQQGRFIEYHLLLYEHFQNHQPQRLLANAEEARVADPEAFVRDLQSEAAFRHITRDIDEGVRAGVSSTPTVFVNGRTLLRDRIPPGMSRYDVLFQEIRSLLRARTS